MVWRPLLGRGNGLSEVSWRSAGGGLSWWKGGGSKGGLGLLEGVAARRDASLLPGGSVAEEKGERRPLAALSAAAAARAHSSFLAPKETTWFGSGTPRALSLAERARALSTADQIRRDGPGKVAQFAPAGSAHCGVPACLSGEAERRRKAKQEETTDTARLKKRLAACYAERFFLRLLAAFFVCFFCRLCARERGSSNPAGAGRKPAGHHADHGAVLPAGLRVSVSPRPPDAPSLLAFVSAWRRYVRAWPVGLPCAICVSACARVRARACARVRSAREKVPMN